MKMNKHFKVILAVSIALTTALSACGPAATPTPTEAPPKAPTEAPTETPTELKKPKRVAVLFPGVVTDHSWNQYGFEGLKKAEEECGVEIAYTENVTQDEQLEIIRNYVAEGYDMIIGHGGEFEDALAMVAEEHPEVWFGVTDGTPKTPNMTGITLSFRQMGYLAGILACNMTKSNHVAYVVGEKLKCADEGFEGFERGVQTCGKDIEVSYVATGDWADVTKGREAALALIDKGVDVLWHMLDTADAGLISAAEDKGVWAIGLYRDSSSLGPKAVLGSMLGSPATEIYLLACGKLEPGKMYHVDVNTPDGVDVHLTDLTPDDVKQKVLEALEKMRSGEISIEP